MSDITKEEHAALLEALAEEGRAKQPEVDDEGIIINKPGSSGHYEAFLSGLSNSEEYQIRWLAEKRFPGLVEQGLDPTLFYYIDDDGDITYADPFNNGKPTKEFYESALWGDTGDYMSWLGPTGQFLAEVAGGVTGMVGGYTGGTIAGGGNPFAGFAGASAGGAGGTAFGASLSYAARAGLSQALGGPPLDVERAVDDGTFASAFGAIPLGVPVKAVPGEFLQGIYKKFPGVEGREALDDIVLNGGTTVDDKLAYMKLKYPDLQITRAEAEGLVGSKGLKLQQWLADQPYSDKLLAFYNNRAVQVEKIAEDFFDDILSGKYTTKSGSPIKDIFGPELDVAAASKKYIETKKKELQQQVAPIYKQAYDLDVTIDIGDVLDEVRTVIKNPNTSPEKLRVYKRIEKALLDGNTGNPRETTELLHLALKDDFNRILSDLSGKNADATLKMEVTKIRNSVQDRLKLINPSYKKATAIYNEATGNAQILDKSIVGQFAKVADLGGTRASLLTQKLFTGKASLDEITDLKTILQSTDEGARAWQNLKGTWLMTQWDEAVQQTTNVLGVPNKFLSRMGIKTGMTKVKPPGSAGKSHRLIFDDAAHEAAWLKERAALRQQSKRAQLYETIFEPDELEAFVDLTDMLHAVGMVQTRAGSNTFANQAIDKIISGEASQVVGSGAPLSNIGTNTAATAEAILNIPSTVFRGTGGKLTDGIVTNQKDAYVDFLISLIIDPKKNVALRESIDVIQPKVYLLSQALGRGGIEGVVEFSDTIDAANQRLELERREPSFGPFKFLEEEPEEEPDPNLQGTLNNFNVPQINQPLFDESELSIQELASPIILPDEADREIAMRQAGGIGSLV